RRQRYSEAAIHERLELDAATRRLTGTILHEPYRDLRHHLTKMIDYSQAGAVELAARGRHATGWQLVAHPFWRFVREYGIYGAWREGRFGLLTAGLGAVTAFLKYAQLLAIEILGTRHSAPGTRREPPASGP